jgi:cold shock CspA family protein
MQTQQSQQEAQKLSGIIKRFYTERGYGLIFWYPKDGGPPVKFFMHVSKIINDVAPEVGRVAYFIPAPPARPGDLKTATEVFVGEISPLYSGGAQ